MVTNQINIVTVGEGRKCGFVAKALNSSMVWEVRLTTALLKPKYYSTKCGKAKKNKSENNILNNAKLNLYINSNRIFVSEWNHRQEKKICHSQLG